jgi:hypothetical protein
VITHLHRLAATGLIAAGFAVASAAEPAVTYLTPETFEPDTGQMLTLRVNAGTPLTAEVAPWPGDQLNWFFVRGGGTQQNRPNIPATARDANAAEFQIAQPGVSVIGLNLKPVVVEMSGDDLKAFLLKNVAGAERDARVAALSGKATVRVRRIESATALVRAPEPAGQERAPSAIAMSKLGLPGELRSLMDPTVCKPGSDWAVRIYIEGSKKSGGRVQATSLADGKTQSAITDQSGAARFHIGAGGTWRVEFHDAETQENDPQADWVLRSGTLTFEVPTEGAGK